MKQYVICLTLLVIALSLKAQYFEDVYEEGNQFYKQKRYREAILNYEQALDSNAIYFNALLKKSYAHYNLDEFQLALETIEKGFDFELLDNRYFYMKAQFYDKLKTPSLAMHYINMAIRFQNDKLIYYNFRADLNLELGNYKEAIADYDYLLTKEPDNYNLYFNRGLAEFNLKNKINACLDWTYAKENDKNCQAYYFYKCTDVDLRPYSFKESKKTHISEPIFVYFEDSSLVDFLNRSLTYPQECINNMEQGTVVVSFVINAQGQLENKEILNSVSPKLDSASLELIEQTAENWEKPAIKNGTPVDFKYVVPLRYKISEPYFVEFSLLDSIRNSKTESNPKKEFEFINQYLKWNPFNYEIALRKIELSKRFNVLITDSNTIDFSKIDAKFINEIDGFSNYYKVYFDDRFRISEVKDAKYYSLSKAYLGSLDLNPLFSIYYINGTKYFEGGLTKRRLQGYFTEFYPNGKVNCEFVFQEGIPINYFNYYYPNGILKHKIFSSQTDFSIIQYNGLMGNSLMNEQEFNWEFSNKDKSPYDTIVIVGKINVKKDYSKWMLYCGDQLQYEEEFKNNKFISGTAFVNGTMVPQSNPNIVPFHFIPMAYTMLEKLEYSPVVTEKTKLLLRSLDPNYYSPFKIKAISN